MPRSIKYSPTFLKTTRAIQKITKPSIIFILIEFSGSFKISFLPRVIRTRIFQHLLFYFSVQSWISSNFFPSLFIILAMILFLVCPSAAFSSEALKAQLITTAPRLSLPVTDLTKMRIWVIEFHIAIIAQMAKNVKEVNGSIANRYTPKTQ